MSYICRTFVLVIEKGEAEPSLLEMIIDKDKAKEKEVRYKKDIPLLKDIKKKQHQRGLEPMNLNEIIAKLGTRDGESEIMEEIRKGKFII